MAGLLALAQSEVRTRWNDNVTGEIDRMLPGILAQIPDEEEAEEVREILQDRVVLEDLLHSHRLGALEPLKTIAPKLRQLLLYVSSQIQREVISLLWRWLLAEDPRVSDAQLRAMRISRAELRLFLEMGAFFQKSLDHAQIKVAGTSTDEEEFASSSDQTVTLPLSQRQPREGKFLVRRLRRMAKRIEKQMRSNTIGSAYTHLPAYLRQIADVYGSDEKNANALSEMRRGLDTAAVHLAGTGCPLMLVPQDSYGEDPGNELQLRIAARTPQTIALERRLQPFRRSAQRIVDQHRGALAEHGCVPPILCNEQLFGFGCNLSWMIPADARRNLIVVSTNVIGEECAGSYRAMRRVMKEFRMDEQDYRSASAEDAALHEIAHTVLWFEDPKVQGRIGEGDAAMMIDELKADTVSMVLQREHLRELKHTASAEEVHALAERKLLSTLGGLCDYVLNNSDEEGSFGQMYYFTAIVILHKLLSEHILRKDGEQYVISDSERGIEVIAEIGDQIIGLYADAETTPETIVQQYRQWRLLKNDPRVQEFLRVLAA